MDRPSPVLPAARLREVSPRANRWKTSGWSSSGTPGPLSRTAEPDLTVVADDARPHDGAGRGMRARVAEQVGDDLVQPRGVALDLDRLVGQVELPDVVGGGGVRVADRVDDHLGEVDGLVVERTARVEAGEQQQVVDERGHPDRLGLDPADRVGDPLGDRLLLAAGQLGIPADRGERGAQLVARVGDELAYPFLALLTLVEGVVDVVEHLVERGARPDRPRCECRCPAPGLARRCRPCPRTGGGARRGSRSRRRGRAGAGCAAPATSRRCRRRRARAGRRRSTASARVDDGRVLLGEGEPDDDDRRVRRAAWES